MDNLNDLKTIWLTAPTGRLPTSEEMLRMVKKFRNQKLRKKVFVIAMAFAAAISTGIIMWLYPAKQWVSSVGQFMIIAACGVLAITNIRSIRRFYQLNDYSNKEFVHFLEQIRKNQLFYYRYTQVTGLVLLSAGLLLNLYEFVHKSIIIFITIYTVAVAYLLTVWLVIRPRAYKKEAHTLNALIEKTKKISEQF